MVNTLNKLIINSLILVFLGILAFVYYDVSNKTDIALLENEFKRTDTVVEPVTEESELPIELIEAGSIKHLQGKVFIKNAAGEQQQLKVGDNIVVGDTIQTGKQSRTQISFTDNSQLTLYADTQLKIIDYSFVDNQPGRNIAQLIKGQLRAVSGLIGKSPKDRYQMRTHVSTIGIRGTEYALRFCFKQECEIDGRTIKPGLYMGVIDGEIIAQSTSGDTIIKKGELFHQLRQDEAATKINVVPGLLVDGEKIATASHAADDRQWILEKVN